MKELFMNKPDNTYTVIIAVLLTVFMLLPSLLTANTSGQDILLLYSNDVKGETAPCG
jgi:hypothetical protein